MCIRQAPWLAFLWLMGPHDLLAQGTPPAPVPAAPQGLGLDDVLSAAAKVAAARGPEAAWEMLQPSAARFDQVVPFCLRRGELAFDATRARASTDPERKVWAQRARTNFDRAASLDPSAFQPALRLAAFAYFEGAAAEAVRRADGLRAPEPPAPAVIRQVARLRGMAHARLAVESFRGTKTRVEKSIDLARSLFGQIEAGGLDGEALWAWSTLEGALGDPKAALEVFVRAVKRDPSDRAALGGLVEVARDTGQSQRAIDTLEWGDSLTLWHFGLAYLFRAFEPDVAGDLPKQFDTLRRSMDHFEACAGSNTAYRKPCDRWQAVVFGCQAYNRLELGDLRLAENLFLASFDKDPSRVAEPTLRDRSGIDGLLAVADAHRRRADEEKRRKTLEQATKFIANAALFEALGVARRDHGRYLLEAGRRADAVEVLEGAGKAWQRAVELDAERHSATVAWVRTQLFDLQVMPEDAAPRLERAIAGIGKKVAVVPALPPAVAKVLGQAHEALGYCFKQSGDRERARAEFRKSLEYLPGADRRAAQWLRELGD